jgi:hypothetical protein
MMPIDPDFPKNHQVIGKHSHADGEHFHFVWGPGRTVKAAENEEVKKSYEARSEQIVPLGTLAIQLTFFQDILDFDVPNYD